MRLVELKREGEPPIWVNPMSVALVEPSGQGSVITFAAIAGEDAVLARRVALSPSQVAEQLNGALRGS